MPVPCINRATLTLAALLLCAANSLLGQNAITAASIPESERSTRFTLTVSGQPVDVAHAASSLDFASFDAPSNSNTPIEIAITALEPGFWERGVEVEPWRLGIRPIREGQTIRFKLTGPAKLSITRPNDFLNHAQMLFLFYGIAPILPITEIAPTIQIIHAGVHRENLTPKSGDVIYFEPGAWLYGSINLFNVEKVRILGRGTIVYDGPQNPNDDEGWKQIPDWHCIGAVEAKNVEISGLTCLVRSRTWSIQMKDSEGFAFNDLRVIGGNPGNANQDGMDWLGGGGTTVRDSFLRASDDVFAMQGNWDGYSDTDLARPGHEVHDILIEHSVLSTSISNIVRAGWPQKIYNSRNFTLRDSDILHAGIGACGQTFGLFGFWGARNAQGEHHGYHFENLFLDHWYSLLQLEQEQSALSDFTFRNIWALDQPPLADSTLTGQIKGVHLGNIKYGQQVATTDADIPLLVSDGAAPAEITGPQNNLAASFTLSPPVFTVKQTITFTAQLPALPSGKPATQSQALKLATQRGLTYHWLFGDGTEAWGWRVRHRYSDALGSDLDGKNGAGRFRVLLEVNQKVVRGENPQEQSESTDWAAQGIVAVEKWLDPIEHGANPKIITESKRREAGLNWKLYAGIWTELPDFTPLTPVFSGFSPNLTADPHGFTGYGIVWEGLLEIPADGGYTFHLLSRDGARLVIDNLEVTRTGAPFAQVCNSPGNAMRINHGSLGLRAGLHTLRVEGLHTSSQGWPRILWQGPGIPLTDLPPAAYSHMKQDELSR
jgi:hypothetical protein